MYLDYKIPNDFDFADKRFSAVRSHQASVVLFAFRLWLGTFPSVQIRNKYMCGSSVSGYVPMSTDHRLTSASQITFSTDGLYWSKIFVCSHVSSAALLIQSRFVRSLPAKKMLRYLAFFSHLTFIKGGTCKRLTQKKKRKAKLLQKRPRYNDF